MAQSAHYDVRLRGKGKPAFSDHESRDGRIPENDPERQCLCHALLWLDRLSGQAGEALLNRRILGRFFLAQDPLSSEGNLAIYEAMELSLRLLFRLNLADVVEGYDG